MDKIPIWLDLFSGLLLACDLLPKSRLLIKIYKKVKKYLKEVDTNNLKSGKSIFFNIFVSLFIFLMLLLWALYKSSSTPETQLGLEIGLFAIGWIIAWVVITPLSMLLNKFNQENSILITGTLISILSIIFIPKLNPPVNVVVSLVAFAYMCMFFSFAITIAKSVRKILLARKKQPFYIFAMVGLTLFVADKLIQLGA